MRDRHNHQLPVASPFPAWVEGQEGQQPQGDSRGRRDLLPGIVQRFSESGAHSPQKGWQGREAGIVGRASPGSDREGPSRGDDGRSAQRPQRSLDHQSAQACRGAGRDPLHGREQILSGICERRERHSCPADRFQEEQGH